MAQKHYYRDLDGTLTDMSAYAPRLKWTAQSKAEEGAYGAWSVTLDDRNSDLVGSQNVVGHRQWFVEDDESEDEDDIIFGGFIGAQTFARSDDESHLPIAALARTITIELIDADTWFSKIVMKGSDCKRPAETDVQRMQWLLGTDEATQIIDTTTYVDTSGPVAMDKADLTGEYTGQIVADCASASGKNYFLWYRKVSGIRTLTIWYGKDTLPDYPSPFYITNDLSVLHGDGVDPAVAEDVWELSKDAKMVRSPERQYCGNLVNYGSKGGRVYRHSASNHAIIASYGSGHRDMVSYFPLVKTKAKAQARGDRQLLDVHPQDVRITTRLVNVPSTRVTLAKAGMLIPGIQGTHWAPTGDDWHEARIVTAQPKPHSKGDLYDIDLELVLGGDAEGPPGPPFTGDMFAGLQRSQGNAASSRGPLIFIAPYDTGVSGWDTQPASGPITIDAPTLNHNSGTMTAYNGFTVSDSMVVRIYCHVYWAQGITEVLNVRVNGVIVGTASRHSGGGSGSLTVDLRNYGLIAGDHVTADSLGSVGGGGGDDVFWSNLGTNGTQFIVGRGSYPGVHLAASGTTTFVGP